MTYTISIGEVNSRRYISLSLCELATPAVIWHNRPNAFPVLGIGWQTWWVCMTRGIASAIPLSCLYHVPIRTLSTMTFNHSPSLIHLALDTCEAVLVHWKALFLSLLEYLSYQFDEIILHPLLQVVRILPRSIAHEPGLLLITTLHVPVVRCPAALRSDGLGHSASGGLHRVEPPGFH